MGAHHRLQDLLARLTGVPGRRAGSLAPPGLGGVVVRAAAPEAFRACSAGDTPSTFEFLLTGEASGPYPGSFSEYGTVWVGPRDAYDRQAIVDLAARFAIASPAAQVGGTIAFVPGVSHGDGICQPATRSDAYAIVASNLRVEATIVLPDGRRCTTLGTAALTLTEHMAELTDDVVHTFSDDADHPVPWCTVDGPAPA